MSLPKSAEISVIKPQWFKRHVQFINGDKDIGELKFTSHMRLNAEATLLNEKWTIKQSGFWKPSLELTAHQSPYTKIKVQPTFGGKLEYKATDGNLYLFRRVKWWKTTAGWFNKKGDVLLQVKPDHSISKRQAGITIIDPKIPDLAVMTFLAFLMFTIHRTQAAAAAT